MHRPRLFVATAATLAAILAFGSLLTLGVFSGGSSVPAVSAQQSQSEDGTISVTGQGQVTQEPDMARAQVGVERTGDDLGEVLADANESMDAVISTLTDLDIPEEDIQTRAFSIQVERDHQAEGRPITGYTVINRVEVSVTPLDQISEVIEEAVSAGANQVGNVTFTVEDSDAAVRQAREQAIENARQKAEHLAELADVSLGSIVSISESDTGPPVPEAVGGAGDAAPPIEPGQQTISLSVYVVYSIE
jgi:uncharacterized protein